MSEQLSSGTFVCIFSYLGIEHLQTQTLVLEVTLEFTEFTFHFRVQTFPVTLQLLTFFLVFTPSPKKYFFHITWKNFL